MKMKTAQIIASVLVIALVIAIAPLYYVPKGAVTIDQLFEGNSQDLNTLAVVEQHDSYLKVLFNGKETYLINNPDAPNSQVFFLSGFGDLDYPGDDVSLDLIGEETLWNHFDSGTEFYVFNVNNGGPIRNSIVAIEKELMPPLVDASTWNDTKASIKVMTHFRPGWMLVYNKTSEELAFAYGIATYDDQHVADGLDIGDGPTWGYLEVEDCKSVQFDHLVDCVSISQSRPNLDKLAAAVKMVQDKYPDEIVYGPVDACSVINRDYPDNNMTAAELIDVCGVYADKFYLDHYPK